MTLSAAHVLGRPFALGRLTVPNRIVMSPMTRSFSPDGIPGDDVAAYYARRAAAGVGLIITEGTYIDHPSAGNDAAVPYLFGEKQLAGWAAVVEAVHAAGGRIVPQLWHIGMVREPGDLPFPDAAPIGPSGLTLTGAERGGRAMTRADIDDVIGAYAQAAWDAERIGFDGIEIHGAHGYLIDQFLWSLTNRRTDGYGGNAFERTRFAVEIVQAIRERVSKDFPVIFRFSQWKASDFDARLGDTPDELQAVLAPLADAGVSAFHASTRRYWEPAFEGSHLNLAAWAKKLTGVAAVTVGSVGLNADFLQGSAGTAGLEALIERLERDEFDLVAVGRALLVDPEWARKVLEGRADDLLPFTPEAEKTLY
ncbi:NADH:flavin oxidoreductase [Streptomyces sp. NBC_00178]|uniref:NADH:flavin oxidoreductase n=1 Tax=Streptomyces sp. NBC_00178 TaxID=2975672 RepID=UPI002E2D35B3|nr:NADH:flavin oxidoreductase [Streptomyces sp. NBC_00178]